MAIDIVFAVDVTHSLAEPVTSLRQTLAECAAIAALTGKLRNLGVIFYGDYTVPHQPVVQWSGWHTKTTELLPFLNRAGDVSPGGDEPEAVKTGLHCLLGHIQSTGQTTLILWFADAPPHHPSNDDSHPNYQRERRALGANFDWVQLTNKAKAAGCVVFPLLRTDVKLTCSFYQYLAWVTGGTANVVPADAPAQLWTSASIQLILRWFGCRDDLLPPLPEATVRGLSWGKTDPPVAADENSLPGFLPCAKGALKKKTLLNLSPKSGTTVVVHPAQLIINRDPAFVKQSTQLLGMKDLRLRFRTDPAFASDVMTGLNHIIKDPSAVGALTESKLFSCLWREAMRVSCNARTLLLATFHRTVAALTDDQRLKMTQWLADSYDQSEEINDAITALPPDGSAPVVYLPYASGICRPQNLTLIALSCRPEDLRKLIKFASRLRTAPAVDPAVATSLPLNLPAADFIPMLPHLLYRGLIFSLRGSAVFAMSIVVSQNRYLLHQAETYLRSIRGTWLDVNDWTFYTFGALRLTKRVHELLPDAFTAEEEKRLRGSRMVQGLLMNGRTDVNLRLLANPCGMFIPDRITRCRACLQGVSFAMICDDGRCTVCLEAGRTVQDPPASGDEVGTSWYRQCWRCASRYAVADTVPSRGNPVCHPCRQKDAYPSRTPLMLTCHTCHCRYRVARNQPPAGDPPFVCPPCEQGERIPYETVTVTIRQLYEDGNETAVFQCAGLAVAGPVDSPPVDKLKSFFMFDPAAHYFRHVLSLLEDAISSTPIPFLRWRGRQVLNAPDVATAIRDWVEQHRAEQGMCGVCCDDFTKEELLPACGRKGCAMTACAGCLDRWYGEIQVGRFVPPANMNCPFCKRCPTAEVLVRHNRNMCQLRRVGSLDPAWHHGFCVGCSMVKRWVERVCAADPPAEANFRCENCSLLDSAQSVFTRDCPKCGVTIERTVGCFHLWHPPPCDTHICFQCGKEQSAQSIYFHMARECTEDDRFRAFYNNREDDGWGDDEDGI